MIESIELYIWDIFCLTGEYTNKISNSVPFWLEAKRGSSIISSLIRTSRRCLSPPHVVHPVSLYFWGRLNLKTNTQRKTFHREWFIDGRLRKKSCPLITIRLFLRLHRTLNCCMEVVAKLFVQKLINGFLLFFLSICHWWIISLGMNRIFKG